MNRKGSCYGISCTAPEGTLNNGAVLPPDSNMVSRFHESSLPSKIRSKVINERRFF